MADVSQAYAGSSLLIHSPSDFTLQNLWTPSSPLPSSARADSAGTAQLVRAIETEVLPRLLLARRHDLSGESGRPALKLQIGTPEEVALFTGLVLEKGMAAVGYIEALQAKDVGLDQIYLQLLEPAARRLGELWNSDLVDFTQVTIGVGHLQLLLRRLSSNTMEEPSQWHRTGRILLMPAAGEQHSFGLVMVAEFFRRAGWDVSCTVGLSMDDGVSLVRDQPFSILGLSLSSENHLEIMAQQIRAMRRASQNRAIGTLVGGHVFQHHPEFVAMLGADATAEDGRQAVAQAESMLGLLAIQC